ncbi:hypothetical protein N0V90_010490 [Kalmusia sp. IMI 367209]|nr:hypothetical protein N0V90_010490 [Kalmusia sp. IMI 367209]
MAEVVGLAASIVQIAGTGIRLSTTLYNFAGGVSRAEQDIADIADDVKLTANALDNVGKVFERDDGSCVISKKAISDAGGLIKRCETVFGEVQDLVEKRSKMGKDGKKTLSAIGRLSWPLKEQRVELLRRRLESLKNSLMLLMHVLQLANGQAKGNIETSALAQEREKIRELHQRQQDSLKALQALESKLDNVSLSDDETLSGSTPPSRVPTIDFLVNSSTFGDPIERRTSGVDTSTIEAPSALAHDSETSGSEDTMTDDGGEHLTVDELAQCTSHVQKLLKRITVLQQSFEAGDPQSGRRFPRNRVHKLYRRFCRKFESEMMVAQNTPIHVAAPLPDFVPPSRQYQDDRRPNRTQDSQPQAQHPSRILPDPFAIAADRNHVNSASPRNDRTTQSNIRAIRPAPEGLHALAAPAYTISSEPLGPGSRPKLPSLISTIPHGSQASPTTETASPGDDQENKHSGTDGDAEQGSHEAGPVVYTKTGRISKAKKGLKVHICEECGRSFTRAEHLRRHQKNHGPNQVRCELCGKVFFRADLLQRHLERHKDLPQGFRFSNAGISPTTEATSPIVADEPHHRPILPATTSSTSNLPPHYSPGDRSVDSSGASGAPTPFEPPAASPAAAQQPRSAWDTTNAVADASGEHAPYRQHAWQSVNSYKSKKDAFEATQQQSNSFQRNLQPKPDPVNNASAQKLYSNILPAPGAPNTQYQQTSPILPSQGYSQHSAPNAQYQQTNYPESYIPGMHRQYGMSPTQATAMTNAAATGPAGYYEPNSQLASGDQLQRIWWSASRSPTQESYPPSASQPMPPRPSLSPQTGNAAVTTPIQPSLRSPTGNAPGNAPTPEQKLSSDKEGVNWRVAESSARPYSKGKKRWTSSQRDGESSGVDDFDDDHSAHRVPMSRSLSLVMPQDERDHALVGKPRREGWYDDSLSFRETASSVSRSQNHVSSSSTDLSKVHAAAAKQPPKHLRSQSDTTIAPGVNNQISPHGGPPLIALSPTLAERRSASRLRADSEVSDRNSRTTSSNNAMGRDEERKSPKQKALKGPLDPESPYSLATINRYVQGRGPEPGAYQGDDLAASRDYASPSQDEHKEIPSLRVSRPIAACERCREYSIKCDGKLPACTACATTKYAGECSFASLPVQSSLPLETMQRSPVTSSYDKAYTRDEISAWHMGQAPKSLHTDQSYDTDEDLPSPYLKPHDRGTRRSTADWAPDLSLDDSNQKQQAQVQSSRKRKADDEQPDVEDTSAKSHERKKSKGNHDESTEKRKTSDGPENGKDIVDLLLEEWTAPVY